MTQDVDKSRSANATTEADEHDEIEITPEMIEAGALVLLRDESLDLGDGYAERVTRRMLKAALGTLVDRNCEDR
jgi:hypothetical protein